MANFSTKRIDEGGFEEVWGGPMASHNLLLSLNSEQDTNQQLAEMDNPSLLRLWASIMEELRRRGVVRSSNNPTADYAEYLVAEKLGLRLVGNSTAGYDAEAPDGTRFQIKGRRLLTPKASRQLSALRKLNTDCFDYLVIVLFGPSFELLEMWQLPIDLAREHAQFQAHVNAYILHARESVLSDPRAVRLL